MKQAPGPFRKSKESPIIPIMKEVVPQNVSDAAWYAVPFGKATRAVGGITKKGAKFVNKLYRNMGN